MAETLITSIANATMARPVTSEPTQYLNSCPVCNAATDVSACEPYAKVTCHSCGGTMRVRRQFNHFEIEAEIGQGGMSRVFRATDPNLGRAVALKILLREFSKDHIRIAQFEKEARITASFSHPHVVKLYSVGSDHNYFYIAMELVESGSVDELIMRKGFLPEGRVLDLGNQVAHGLQAAFWNGLIHRDIKPGNILISTDNTAKIVDFGLALVVEREKDESGEIWGTPYYVPPEKLYGDPEDFRSDIYSLGATFFHMLTGKPPFQADTSSIDELKRIKDRPVFLERASTGISSETCAVVDRMLSRNPEDRHSSYEELIHDLQVASRALQKGAHSVYVGAAGNKSERVKHGRRARLARTLCVAALGMGIAYLIFLYITNNGGPTTIQPLQNDLRGADADERIGPTSSETFLRGRRALLAGDYDRAIQEFQDFYYAEDSQQPPRSWAVFNHGIALLIQGEEEASREVFAKLEEQRGFGTHVEGTRAKRFFHELGALMKRDSSIDLSRQEGIEGGSPEMAALMAYALKNWNLGAFESAGQFLRTLSVLPATGEYLWIDDYREHLLGDYLKDLGILEQIQNPLALDDAEALRDRAETLKRWQDDLRTSGAAHLAIADAVRAHEQRAAELQEMQRQAEVTDMIRRERSEWLRLNQVIREVAPLAANREFSKALDILNRESFFSEGVKLALEDQKYLWEQADFFVVLLLENMNLGFVGEVPRIGLPPLRGEVVAADPHTVVLRFSGSQINLSFRDITPDGLITIAESIIQQTRDSNSYFRQQEALIAFADRSGSPDIAFRHGAALSRENRTFRERWNRIQTQVLNREPLN